MGSGWSIVASECGSKFEWLRLNEVDWLSWNASQFNGGLAQQGSQPLRTPFHTLNEVMSPGLFFTNWVHRVKKSLRKKIAQKHIA